MVKGQSVFKLYVIFNVLEVADRLCCSFGQDILDAFMAKFERTYSPRKNKDEFSHSELLFNAFLALIYIRKPKIAPFCVYFFCSDSRYGFILSVHYAQRRS